MMYIISYLKKTQTIKLFLYHTKKSKTLPYMLLVALQKFFSRIVKTSTKWVVMVLEYIPKMTYKRSLFLLKWLFQYAYSYFSIKITGYRGVVANVLVAITVSADIVVKWYNALGISTQFKTFYLEICTRWCT